MKTFHWFPVASTIELRDRLNAAGDAPRLEIHHGEHGQPLLVVKAGMTDGGFEITDEPDPINDSKVCPPICP